MTLSINNPLQAAQASWQSRKADTPVGAAAPAAPAATLPAADPTGIQSFASELHSFLVSLQSGQDAAIAPAPGGAATSQAVGGVAERLQTLLKGVDSAAAEPATDTTPTDGSLNSVLDKLQATVSRTLQGYAAAAPASPATDLLS